MSYVEDARPWIERAFNENFAIVSFNVVGMEMVKACVNAAEQEEAPLMIQTSPVELEIASPREFAGMVRAVADCTDVPVMLHLDHGDSLARVAEAIRAGYSSVMFDGDALPRNENVGLSSRVAEFAHAAGVCMEAAAGSFGGEGESQGDNAELTDPEYARELWKHAHADLVACSVGSMHGQSSRLNLDVLRKIYEIGGRPIALHGGTGIDHADLAEALNYGAAKLNIGMGLIRRLLTVWREHSESADMHIEVYKIAMEQLTEVAREKLRATRSSGKL